MEEGEGNRWARCHHIGRQDREDPGEPTDRPLWPRLQRRVWHNTCHQPGLTTHSMCILSCRDITRLQQASQEASPQQWDRRYHRLWYFREAKDIRPIPHTKEVVTSTKGKTRSDLLFVVCTFINTHQGFVIFKFLFSCWRYNVKTTCYLHDVEVERGIRWNETRWEVPELLI